MSLASGGRGGLFNAVAVRPPFKTLPKRLSSQRRGIGAGGRAKDHPYMSEEKLFATRARTKIVATLGPACAAEEKIAELVQAGADVFRLNMAHGSREEHIQTLQKVRRVEQRLSQPIGLLVDLAGPKIRLGDLPQDEVQIHPGEEYRFVRGSESHGDHEFTSTYAPLIDEVSVGKMIMLADGTISMLVEEKGRDFVRARCIQGGPLRSRQGINLPGAKLSTPAMSDVDIDNAMWAADAGADFISLSFVRSAEDVRSLKSMLLARGCLARVIAKIEKPEAVEQLDAVVQAADGVMVARGDLGVEMDLAGIAVVQKKIVDTCNRRQKPVIIATQMLDSMQHSLRPTRAEATDVANAILDGADACMLSGETAVGQYPRESVQMMDRIAQATEPLLSHRTRGPAPSFAPQGVREITRAVVYGAGHISSELGAKLVVVASHTGATALALAKQRNFIPTVGVSDSPTVLRQMCLMWGVIPLTGAPVADREHMIRHVETWGQHVGALVSGDRIVVITSSSISASGHNVLLVHEVA